MSFTQIGSCPQCGAPIYAPSVWHGVTPPPPQYSCACFRAHQVAYSTDTLYVSTEGTNMPLQESVDYSTQETTQDTTKETTQETTQDTTQEILEETPPPPAKEDRQLSLDFMDADASIEVVSSIYRDLSE